MKALIIGGTGTISTAVVHRLAAQPLWDVWVLNRGRRSAALPDNVKALTADINDEAAVQAVLGDTRFDAVCQFIAYTEADGNPFPRFTFEFVLLYIFLPLLALFLIIRFFHRLRHRKPRKKKRHREIEPQERYFT